MENEMNDNWKVHPEGIEPKTCESQKRWKK